MEVEGADWCPTLRSSTQHAARTWTRSSVAPIWGSFLTT